MLLMAALLLLSTMNPSDADARKRKRVTTVNCPTSSDGFTCNGTSGANKLVGRAAYDIILGDLGNDIYQGKGTATGQRADILYDSSFSSNDKYQFYGPFSSTTARNSSFDSGEVFIKDNGGSSDVIELTELLYPQGDSNENSKCTRARTDGDGDGTRDDYKIDCPEARDIIVIDQFTSSGRVDYMRFASGLYRTDYPEEMP